MIDIMNNIVNCKIDYENIIAVCPHCNQRNIFNRVTDLKTIEIVFEKEVKCLFCNGNFRIGGDVMNPAFELLYYDCYPLKTSKKYMQICINLSTCYEMFFLYILRFYLTVKPMKYYSQYDSYIYNQELNSLLNDKIENFTFGNLLCEVINLFIYLEMEEFKTKEQCKNYINTMNSKKRNADISHINNISNKQIRNKLIVILKLYEKQLLINKLRNKVVHKQGYRPSLKEVKKQLLITKKVIIDFHYVLMASECITDNVREYKALLQFS